MLPILDLTTQQLRLFIMHLANLLNSPQAGVQRETWPFIILVERKLQHTFEVVAGGYFIVKS